jgi:hypothetical protein
MIFAGEEHVERAFNVLGNRRADYGIFDGVGFYVLSVTNSQRNRRWI